MASIIKAGNATDGVQISSDATGALDIKTGTGAGTTAISIDASQNVAIPGTLTIAGQPAGGNYALNAYTSPTTWTKPAGLKAVKVTVVGAGGSGGPVSTNPVSTPNATGGGGGGGGAAIDYIPAPSIPGPIAVTAGSGTNSFGALCSATAGSNGGSASAPSPANIGAGGSGGSGSGGQINLTGGTGYPGSPAAAGTGAKGSDGLLGLGVGGVAFPAVSPATNGVNGSGYGSGGSGASRGPIASVGSNTGGSGAPGIVIVEEFY